MREVRKDKLSNEQEKYVQPNGNHTMLCDWEFSTLQFLGTDQESVPGPLVGARSRDYLWPMSWEYKWQVSLWGCNKDRPEWDLWCLSWYLFRWPRSPSDCIVQTTCWIKWTCTVREKPTQSDLRVFVTPVQAAISWLKEKFCSFHIKKKKEEENYVSMKLKCSSKSQKYKCFYYRGNISHPSKTAHGTSADQYASWVLHGERKRTVLGRDRQSQLQSKMGSGF